MGRSYYNDDDYTLSVNHKVATHGTSFTYDKDVKTGVVAPKTANQLDPKNLKVRESRDSKEHPNSNAIIVALDVTGSMGSVSHTIHSKLPALMGLLLKKNYIEDPQVLFAAVGDYNSDTAPLQVGQFESGVEMESDISKFWLEGGGGGQIPPQESYELMAYVGARKTSIDCFEKRGRKGYFFFIGDERPYPKVSKAQISHLISPELEADIPTPEVFKELQKMYNVFYVLPARASHGRDYELVRVWQDLIGPEHVLKIEDEAGVPELIAAQIGMCEGATDEDKLVDDLKDVGSQALVPVIRSSVSRAYKGGEVAKVTPGTLAPSSGPSKIKRL
jgi:hypothetical protein